MSPRRQNPPLVPSWGMPYVSTRSLICAISLAMLVCGVQGKGCGEDGASTCPSANLSPENATTTRGDEVSLLQTKAVLSSTAHQWCARSIKAFEDARNVEMLSAKAFLELSPEQQRKFQEEAREVEGEDSFLELSPAQRRKFLEKVVAWRAQHQGDPLVKGRLAAGLPAKTSTSSGDQYRQVVRHSTAEAPSDHAMLVSRQPDSNRGVGDTINPEFDAGFGQAVGKQVMGNQMSNAVSGSTAFLVTLVGLVKGEELPEDYWKDLVGLALDWVGTLNPYLGFFCGLLKGIIGGSGGDADAQLSAAIDKKISAETSRILGLEMKAINEEIGWVPDMLNAKLVDKDVRLSYFLTIQHDLSMKKEVVFHEECWKVQPWKKSYDTRRLDTTGDACKAWCKDGGNMNLMFVYAETHLSALHTLIAINPNLRDVVMKRIAVLATQYAGLIKQAYSYFLPWRMTQFESDNVKTHTGEYSYCTGQNGGQHGESTRQCFPGMKDAFKGQEAFVPKVPGHEQTLVLTAKTKWDKDWKAIRAQAKVAYDYLGSTPELRETNMQSQVTKKLGVEVTAPTTPCASDNDQCLLSSVGDGDWSKTPTCATASMGGYCETYPKTLLRCCPESCGLLEPNICNKAACEKLGTYDDPRYGTCQDDYR